MMFHKFSYFRSKAHLRNVASLPCQWCGIEGQTQAAHSNQAKHGKGRSIKASDEFTAALCVDCHFQIDQGSLLTQDERLEIWDMAWKRTAALLNKAGKWPKNVELPE
jgi:hypothetical protein